MSSNPLNLCMMAAPALIMVFFFFFLTLFEFASSSTFSGGGGRLTLMSSLTQTGGFAAIYRDAFSLAKLIQKEVS